MATRTDPLLRGESYTYDANGNPAQVRDALGSPVTIRNALDQEWLLTHDAAGQLTSITDPLTESPTTRRIEC